MTNHTGIEGVVRVGSAVVGEVRSFNFNSTAQLISTKKLGDLWETYKSGVHAATGKITCFWDENDTTGQIALQTAFLAGTSVTLTLCPEGYTTGDAAFSLTAFLDSLDLEVSDNDAIIGATFGFKASGALTSVTAP